MKGAAWLGRAATAVVAAGLLLGAAPGAAQSGPGDEVQQLREASIREAEGDMPGAERLLLDILGHRASSVPALLALERVLRIEGRLGDLVPALEAALAEDPTSALLNQLLVRTYSALDRTSELEAAGRRWIAAVPELETPYREMAGIWAGRGDPARARAVLEAGRQRIGRADALALELGDLYAAAGEIRLAVREWERAVGPDAKGLNQVRRRLRTLPDGGAGALPELVDLLVVDEAPLARLEAAVDLAVDAGLERRAQSIAERVLPRLPAADRERLLIDVARRADGAHLSRLAYWAYGALSESESEGGRLLAIRNRLAELALELGDTARAEANYRAVEAAYEEGTPQRRQAAALRIELMARQDASAAAEALQDFRRGYADAPELDRLAAAVATALMGSGRAADAELVLAGVRGPRSALLRGRIALERGAVEEARIAYLSAAPGLRGGEATRTLALVTVLARLSDPGGALLGEALRLREAGDPGAAVDRVVGGLSGVRPEDRPTLLEAAAGIADEAGLAADAREIRRKLIAEFPRASEAPAALLELARGVRPEEGGEAEARELLERLIIEYPRSALVPQARRELQQLTRGGAGAGRSTEQGSRP